MVDRDPSIKTYTFSIFYWACMSWSPAKDTSWHVIYCIQKSQTPFSRPLVNSAGLENSTRTLVFTSASGCRASENFDISSENQ